MQGFGPLCLELGRTLNGRKAPSRQPFGVGQSCKGEQGQAAARIWVKWFLEPEEKGRKASKVQSSEVLSGSLVARTGLSD